MLRRLGVIFAALAASFAFAASAQAAPTTPGLKPIPYWVCNSSLPISWTPSTPDPVGTIVGYRVDIGDLTAGTSSAKFTSALGTTLTGLVARPPLRRARARAAEALRRLLVLGLGRRHVRAPVRAIPPWKISREYVEYNPWPECIMCGRLENVLFDDPIIYRAIDDAVLPAGALPGPPARRAGRDHHHRRLVLRQPPAPGRDQLVHLLRAV